MLVTDVYSAYKQYAAKTGILHVLDSCRYLVFHEPFQASADCNACAKRQGRCARGISILAMHRERIADAQHSCGINFDRGSLELAIRLGLRSEAQRSHTRGRLTHLFMARHDKNLGATKLATVII